MTKTLRNSTKIFLYNLLNNFLRKIIQLRFKTGNTRMSFIGNHYSGYWFPNDLLKKAGSVYGAGLGNDSSFEFELSKIGYSFLGFEPEKSAYLKSKSHFSDSSSLVFNFGLSNISGNFVSRGDNFSIAETYSHKPITNQIFKIRSLWEIAKELELSNSKKPRILKMNIEGAEKEILQQLIVDPLPFEIIIFQAEFLFHLRFFQFNRRFRSFIEIWKILKRFKQLGWNTIHISKNQITLSNVSFDHL
jgi:hypothetical protein